MKGKQKGKTAKKNKQINSRKKTIWIVSIAAAVCVIAGICAAYAGITAAKKSITVVGFYKLPEEYVNAIEAEISELGIEKVKFNNLTEEDMVSEKAGEKNSIIFAYNDANTRELAEAAIPLNNEITERIPSTLKKSPYFENSKNQTVIMPVVIDNFESSVLRTTRTKYGIQWPETFSGLESFGEEAKKVYPAPLIIAGERDINVLSLFTELIIAFGGQSGYETVKNQLKKSEDFNELLETKINDSGMTVKDCLKELKNLQEKGYLVGGWTKLTEKDTCNLIDDNRTGANFMNLSENRRKTMPNIQFYEIQTFPVETEYKELSVQPVVAALMFKNTTEGNKILTALASEEVQTELSMATKLGPAMLRGSSYDIQADDARYLAASTRGGAVPDLGGAAYKTEAQRHKLADNLRKWFE